jgi:hypothetical protein
MYVTLQQAEGVQGTWNVLRTLHPLKSVPLN